MIDWEKTAEKRQRIVEDLIGIVDSVEEALGDDLDDNGHADAIQRLRRAKSLEADVVKTAMELWTIRDRVRGDKSPFKDDDRVVAQIRHDGACRALEMARIKEKK